VESNIQYPKNPFKKGTQNYRVYEALTNRRKITNIELISMKILRGSARVWDINQYLQPFLLEVKCKAVPDRRGVFEYSLG